MSGGAGGFLTDWMNAAPGTGSLITTKDEADDKRRQQEAAAQQEAQRKKQLLAEQRRVEQLPENVRTRATASARMLSESGKRPTASQYLSGS